MVWVQWDSSAMYGTYYLPLLCGGVGWVVRFNRKKNVPGDIRNASCGLDYMHTW